LTWAFFRLVAVRGARFTGLVARWLPICPALVHQRVWSSGFLLGTVFPRRPAAVIYRQAAVGPGGMLEG
jgi:hypothetical protein